MNKHQSCVWHVSKLLCSEIITFKTIRITLLVNYILLLCIRVYLKSLFHWTSVVTFKEYFKATILQMKANMYNNYCIYRNLYAICKTVVPKNSLFLLLDFYFWWKKLNKNYSCLGLCMHNCLKCHGLHYRISTTLCRSFFKLSTI